MRWSTLLTLTFLLAACGGSSNPTQSINIGDVLASYDFEQQNSFEEGSYNSATLRLVDGAYQIDVRQGEGELWWGQWGDSYGDVAIDVELLQLTERNENAYGVMCRVAGSVGRAPEPLDEDAALDTDEAESDEAEDATPDPVDVVPEQRTSFGNGYLFLIQGNGSYAIMRASEREVIPLVDWTEAPEDLMEIGRNANNTMRAVCVDDYLALFINDQFVAEAADDTYTEGQIGMAASSYNRLGVRVEFDNLVVSEASR